MRVLPLFSGLLALAWVYRAGRDLVAPLVGLVAVLLLATFGVLHHLHACGARLLFGGAIRGDDHLELLAHCPAPVCQWAGPRQRNWVCWWAVSAFSTRITMRFCCWLGLGFWHLLFMPKNRQWWRPVMLFGLAGMTFLLELEGFLHGVGWTQNMPWHTTLNVMQRTTEVLPWFLFVFTNGILRLPGVVLPAALNMLVLLFLFLLVLGFWKRFRKYQWFRQIQFLLFCTLSMLLLMLFINEILLVMRVNRLRYLMSIWPLCSLLVGWVVWRARGRWRLITSTCLGAFIVFGIWVNVAGELQYEIHDLLKRYTIHPLSKQIGTQSNQLDLLLIDNQVYQEARDSGYYFAPFPERHLIVGDSPGSRAELARAVREHLRFWLLAGEADSVEHRAMTAQLPPDMVFCGRFIQRKNLVLELYAWSVAYCPIDTAQLRFGEGIELVASEVTVIPADILRVDLLMHTEEITGMTAYSVALHVFDVESGEKVAQGDRGLWLGRYNPLRSEIDISGLMAGEYELRVGVYNWQTLERLEGVDLTSGATAELLTLSRFRIE